MEDREQQSSNDFASNALINKIPRHDKDINWIKKKVGDKESFARTFVEAAKESVALQECINQLVDKHDNHKIKIDALALAKWGFGAIVGAIITWLATQAIIIPQYRMEIDSLKNQIQTQADL